MTPDTVAPPALQILAANAIRPTTQTFTFWRIWNPSPPLQLPACQPSDHQMTSNQLQAVHVVGGGLAGSEATWQLAYAGVPVVLHEMRPLRVTPAHKTDGYAELV